MSAQQPTMVLAASVFPEVPVVVVETSVRGDGGLVTSGQADDAQ